MNKYLELIKTNVYVEHGLRVSDFKTEEESKEYHACRFTLNTSKIVCRSAKTTPKKQGQFVTFWKRNSNGVIEPLHESDSIDYYAVTVKSNEELGQFLFPKSILIQKGVILTDNKEGKRGFRIYPDWDDVKSKQAIKTQDWQLNYFYKIGEKVKIKKVLKAIESTKNLREKGIS